jgi:hypothetical protein
MCDMTLIIYLEFQTFFFLFECRVRGFTLFGGRGTWYIFNTSEIIMAQYVGIAGSVLKGPKCALYCCLLCYISYTFFFFYKHSISYELKVIRCCHATHYNGISSLLIKAMCNVSFSTDRKYISEFNIS